MADLHLLLFSGMGYLFRKIHMIHGLQVFSVEMQYVYKGSCDCHPACDLIYIKTKQNTTTTNKNNVRISDLEEILTCCLCRMAVCLANPNEELRYI